MSTRVVHVNRDEYTTYVGRSVRYRPDLKPLGWGNPFTGENAIGRFREWLMKQPALLARLPELKDQVLGCWCAPKGGLPGDINGRICHGQVLAALADGVSLDTTTAEATPAVSGAQAPSRDLVVTVPLSFGLDTWIAEGDPAGTSWSGTEWDFYLGGARPDVQPGCRMYCVYNGAVRGYAPLVRIDSDPREPWRYSLVRRGGAMAVTIPEYVQGFRGFRYRWWDRSIEVPFPDWQNPDACIGWTRKQVRKGQVRPASYRQGMKRQSATDPFAAEVQRGIARWERGLFDDLEDIG